MTSHGEQSGFRTNNQQELAVVVRLQIAIKICQTDNSHNNFLQQKIEYLS